MPIGIVTVRTAILQSEGHMNRQTFVVLFVIINIGMIILQIKKHTNMIGQLYQKQRNEKIKEELLNKKAAAMREFYELKNPTAIKKFAINELQMKKVELKQVISVAEHEN